MAVQPGFFGKLPCNGDFLRYGNQNTFNDQWDQWLQRCLHHCQSHLGEEPWLSTYLTSPLWRFLLHKGAVDDESYLGFMIPSVDAGGRYFPFTVSVALGRDGDASALMSNAHRWFAEMEGLVLSLLEQDNYQPSALYRQLQNTTQRFVQHGKVQPLLRTAEGVVVRSTEHEPAGTSVRLWQLFHQQQPQTSLWWTDGSDKLLPTTLSLQGLPSTATFLAMMNGQWPEVPSHGSVRIDTQSLNTPLNSAHSAGGHAAQCHSYGVTHPGHVRQGNEDLLLNEPHRQLWAVADGMGGHARGDIASYKLVEALAATPLSSDISTAASMIRQTVTQVNKELYHLSDEIIGTTLALLFITGDQALCLWVGDSRIYRLDDQGEMLQLTRDHSVLDATQGDHVLTHAIGADEQAYMDQRVIPVAPTDRFLLCSDGVYGAISQTQIQTVLQQEISPENATKELVARVLATPASDNLTAIVIDPPKP